MTIELLANPRTRNRATNGGRLSTALPVASLGSTDIFPVSTPLDATYQKVSFAHFHYILRKTSEPLPETLYLAVEKEATNADLVEIVVDPAVYEADISPSTTATSEIAIDISGIATADIVGSFWLRRICANTETSTPRALSVTLKFKTK